MATIQAAEVRNIVPLTQEEVDQLIDARLGIEDRSLIRKVTNKWRTHLREDTRDAESGEKFLLELEGFALAYRKNSIIVKAEQRQVVEYQESKARLEQEVLAVLEEIERLKITLEESQEQRRRKIAYDEISDKINELPPREEQERQIATLEAEIAGIKEEQEMDRKIKEDRRAGVLELNRVLDLLRIVGKGAEAVVLDSDTLVPESIDVEMTTSQPTVIVDGEMEEGEEREIPQGSSASTIEVHHQSSKLNPLAPEFRPRQGSSSVLRSRVLRGDYDVSSPRVGSPAPAAPSPAANIERRDEDVEMGEVIESPKPPTDGSRPNLSTVPTSRDPSDELEEGEASESSSLTPEPDD
ncbi:hypothetical protein FRB91_003529 [Serendipita sp. 411]|nr:hypothetical protein FRB91_003529 [Serendipita sp. 411]